MMNSVVYTSHIILYVPFNFEFSLYGVCLILNLDAYLMKSLSLLLKI